MPLDNGRKHAQAFCLTSVKLRALLCERGRFWSTEAAAENDARVPPAGFHSNIEAEAPQPIKSSVQMSGCWCWELLFMP